MVNMMVRSIKILLTILYGISFLSLFSLPPIIIDYQAYVLAFVFVVLIVHIIEFFVMKTKVENIINNKMSFLKTMLWGFGYWLPLVINNSLIMDRSK